MAVSGHAVGAFTRLRSVALAISWSMRVISTNWLVGCPSASRTAIWCGSSLPKPFEASISANCDEEEPPDPPPPPPPPPPQAETHARIDPMERDSRMREVDSTCMGGLLTEEVREDRAVQSGNGLDAGLEHVRVHALDGAGGELEHVHDARVGDGQEHELRGAGRDELR